MRTIVIQRNFDFFLATINVSVNGQSYMLKPISKIEAPINSDKIEIVVWWKGFYTKVTLNDGNEINNMIVRQYLPQWYYIVSICLVISLLTLVLLGVISSLFLSVTAFACFFPIIYSYAFKRHKFFKYRFK